MKAILLLLLCSACCFGDTIEVYFSPQGGCTAAAVKEIGKARQGIVMEAYNFTSPEILQALKAAIRRGVAVRVLYDRSQKNDAATLADDLGVPRKYGAQKIMHNKVLILDSRTVLTGSFNFTVNAEKYNAENMVILRSKTIAKKYLDAFQQLLLQAR